MIKKIVYVLLALAFIVTAAAETAGSIKLFCRMPDRPLLEGETVFVEYTLINETEAVLTDAEITSSTGFSVNTGSVEAGESFSAKEYITVSFPLTVSAEVSSDSKKLAESNVIKAETANAEVKLSCVYDESVESGSSARITVNVENAGNLNYTMWRLSCPLITIPEINDSTLKAGQFTSINLTTPVLHEDTVYEFIFTGTTQAGTETELITEPITIKVTGETDSNSLKLPEAEVIDMEELPNTLIARAAGFKGVHKYALIVCGVELVCLAAYFIVKLLRRRKKS